jgi:hypothetical protein
MRSITTRVLPLVLTIVVMAAACGSGNDSGDATGGDSTNRISVDVVDGRVEGVDQRVDVGLGDKVAIQVTSDAADEVHVHGYDKKVNVTPNQAATVSFTADIPGAFEVELEESGLLLFELRVQ